MILAPKEIKSVTVSIAFPSICHEVMGPDAMILVSERWVFLFCFFFVVDFVIHWNETAMGLHVFPIPIPPPTSLSTRSL